MTRVDQVHKEGPVEDEWSWRKFMSGFFSGKRYGKDHAILFRMIIIVAFWGLVIYGGLSLLKSQKSATPKDPTIINAEGVETIDNSTKKSDNDGFINLFNWSFGGKNQ